MLLKCFPQILQFIPIVSLCRVATCLWILFGCNILLQNWHWTLPLSEKYKVWWEKTIEKYMIIMELYFGTNLQTLLWWSFKESLFLKILSQNWHCQDWDGPCMFFICLLMLSLWKYFSQYSHWIFFRGLASMQ